MKALIMFPLPSRLEKSSCTCSTTRSDLLMYVCSAAAVIIPSSVHQRIPCGLQLEESNAQWETCLTTATLTQNRSVTYFPAPSPSGETDLHRAPPTPPCRRMWMDPSTSPPRVCEPNSWKLSWRRMTQPSSRMPRPSQSHSTVWNPTCPHPD